MQVEILLLTSLPTKYFVESFQANKCNNKLKKLQGYLTNQAQMEDPHQQLASKDYLY